MPSLCSLTPQCLFQMTLQVFFNSIDTPPLKNNIIFIKKKIWSYTSLHISSGVFENILRSQI